jgi:site-specific recombinase XerD
MDKSKWRNMQIKEYGAVKHENPILNYGPKEFRHTFGRHMIEARVPVTTIQKLMGHARLHTTETYLHISDKQVQADYEAAMEQVMERLSLDGDICSEGGQA